MNSIPVSGVTTADSFLPAYDPLFVDSIPLEAFGSSMKSDSGVNYKVPTSKKRIRESTTPFLYYPASQKPKTCGFFSFLGEDITIPIQNHTLEASLRIDQYMKRMKLEIEEKHKTQARKRLQEIELTILRTMKAKEIEIETMVKMNWELEEKVKSLTMDTQMWRDLAQSNEATVIALRTNFEQLLEQTEEERKSDDNLLAAAMDDAQSSCGSNGDEADGGEESNSHGRVGKMCINCGIDEACVLILPCRHLCLCTVCGSSLQFCPICEFTPSTTDHINM